MGVSSDQSRNQSPRPGQLWRGMGRRQTDRQKEVVGDMQEESKGRKQETEMGPCPPLPFPQAPTCQHILLSSPGLKARWGGGNTSSISQGKVLQLYFFS